MAFLKNHAEAELGTIISGNGVYRLSDPLKARMNCRVPWDDDKCIIPKPGYVTNLQMGRRTPIPGGTMKAAEYEELPQSTKDFFVEFVNNVGSRYLIGCPYSCKILGK